MCVHTFPKLAIKRMKRVFKYIGITLDDNYFQHYFLKKSFSEMQNNKIILKKEDIKK